MPEYKPPVLDKSLNIAGTGLGMASGVASALGTTAASGLMGATMAGLLTNPFTAPIAAILPFAAKLFGPGSAGPKMTGATNVVEPYDKLLTQRRDDFLRNNANASPEAKLAFAAEQEAIIQKMFDELQSYEGQLGDIGKRSIAERQQGGKHDFYKYYVQPIVGTARAADFAKANDLEMPAAGGFASSGGGLNLSRVMGGGGTSASGGGSAAAPFLNLGGGGFSASNIAPLTAAGGSAMFGGLGSTLGNIFGNKTFQTILTNALPGVLGLLGGLGQRSSNDKANATLQQGLSSLLGRGDEFANLSADQQQKIVESVGQLLGMGGQTPEFMGLQSDIANTGSMLPLLFGGNTADPAVSSMMLRSILDPRISNAMSSASNLAQSGGVTPELAEMARTGSAFMSGGSGQQMKLQGQADELLQSGGLTPFLQMLQGAGGQALATQGMTPQLQQALGPMMSLLRSGGRTPEASQLFGRGMDLFSREALLPMSTAINFAGDAAGRAVGQQAEAARREAQARGGGPGAVVGAGSANSARADFANDAAGAIAAARQQAALGQQGLQLQQQATGANAAGGAADLMKNLLGLGQSGVANILGTAAGREQGLAGLGGTAQQIALGRTGQAADMMGAIINAALSGGNLANQAVNTATNRQNVGFGAIQGLGGLTQGGFNALLGNLLTGSGQGIQQGQAIGGLFNQNQELLSRNEISRMGNITQLLSLLSGLSDQNSRTASTLYGAGSGLYSPLATGQQKSPLATATTALGTQLPGIFDAWNKSRIPASTNVAPATNWNRDHITTPIQNPFSMPPRS